jgi:uncharacterized protein YndB with AHSA1/START domain
MLRTILLGVLAIAVVGVAFIASRPASFTVQRSAEIAAPPEAVFALLNDFHQWNRWSPWEKLDPNMKRSFDGPTSGPGASYAWAGNDQVGEGRMKIVESKPGESVTLDLEFLKPFAAKNRTSFTLAPSGAGTRVTWAMKGENGFLGKAMSLVMDMDALVGKDFETGLANLDQAARQPTPS